MHLTQLIRGDRLEKFYERFDVRLARDSKTGCDLWVGETTIGGYGRVAVEVDGVRYRFYTHRVNFERHQGAIRKGLTLDHRVTCLGNACCRPSHLEAVTRAENTLRQMKAKHGSIPGKRCKRGHVGEYAKAPGDGKHYCKGCGRERMKARYDAAKGKV